MPRKPACQALELPRFHPQPPPVQTRNLHTDSDTLWTRTNSKEIPSRSRAIQSQHVHENVLDLALRTIGAVCALLFGIWAPLSYQLQKDGNKGNDAAQEELVRLRKEVEVMNRQMKWTGLLKILEICEKGNSVQGLDACKQLESRSQLNRLIESIILESSPAETTNSPHPAPTYSLDTIDGISEASVEITLEASVEITSEASEVITSNNQSLPSPMPPLQTQIINVVHTTVVTATLPHIDFLISTAKELPQYHRPTSFSSSSFMDKEWYALRHSSSSYQRYEAADITVRLDAGSWMTMGIVIAAIWVLSKAEERVKDGRWIFVWDVRHSERRGLVGKS